MNLLGIASTGTGAVQPVPGHGTTGEAPVLLPVPSHEPLREIDLVLAKIERDEDLTIDEFMTYIRAVEAANPGFRWPHLATKLHARSKNYSGDQDMVVMGIPLFRFCKENEGWRNVNLLRRSPGRRESTPPIFIRGRTGKRIDVAHTYAAAAAEVGRNVVTGAAMTWVNTTGGDQYQVAVGLVEGAIQTRAGFWRLARSGFEDSSVLRDGVQQIKVAPRYLPPDQARGNILGCRLALHLSLHRSSVTLSEAYAKVFRIK